MLRRHRSLLCVNHAVLCALLVGLGVGSAVAQPIECSPEALLQEGRDEPGSLQLETHAQMCRRLNDLRDSLRHEQLWNEPVFLRGESELGCQQFNLAAFEGMALESLIPDALPTETRVLFRPLESLEHRPQRLTLFATREGEITQGTCVQPAYWDFRALCRPALGAETKRKM